MPLVKNRSYFIAATDVVLREEADSKSKPVNHLLFGDWVKYLGQKKDEWAKVHSRGNDGWVSIGTLQEERILEVNFVDIGQGDGCHIVTPDDEIILIDAGIGDNMIRFLHWRYNLRWRKVAGVDGVSKSDPAAKPPVDIDYVVITHPDKDHYMGFQPVFANRKLKIHRVYQNGIIERTIIQTDKEADLYYYSNGDLGGWIEESGRNKYLWDVMRENSETRALLEKHKNTGKDYIPVLYEAIKNNASVSFQALNSNDAFLDKFDQSHPLTLHVLGPVAESKTRNGKTKDCLKRLGNEGETKNGHSVVLKLQFDLLRVLLGGDLNTRSEDYLLQHYCKIESEVSKLEKLIEDYSAEGENLDTSEKHELQEARTEVANIIEKAREVFEVDVLKACHHGSHHFSEAFLQSLNAVATVISSGDNEGYAHPRPDALGAFGKYGRGVRPLIFSTELARSTNEFTNVFKYYEELREYEQKIANAATQAEKDKLQLEMESRRDSNVARYGMITLRTDGDKTIIAQKLEVAGGNDKKWDIHEIEFNPNTGQFEYVKKTG